MALLGIAVGGAYPTRPAGNVGSGSTAMLATDVRHEPVREVTYRRAGRALELLRRRS